MLAIVGRGLPVVTKATWFLAQGDPAKIPEGSVVFHRPLAMITAHSFAYTAHFRARAGNVVETLKTLAALPKCRWVVKPWKEDPAEGCAAVAPRLAAVGASATRVRADVIHLTDHDCVRTWIRQHRSIATSSMGDALRATHEALIGVIDVKCAE